MTRFEKLILILTTLYVITTLLMVYTIRTSSRQNRELVKGLEELRDQPLKVEYKLVK